MKHSNISIFIPHNGCPNKCSFCNQHTISGAEKSPTPDEVYNVCRHAWAGIASPANTEIAFFGGSFTAIPRSYMTSLLESVQDFVGVGKFHGIRISTRPDCIDPGVLDILKRYNVTAIELGAQSMSDRVLKANDRGHSAEDIFKASDLIKSAGFELGLQMMIGLYKSTIQDERETIDRIIGIKPDTVRIYPTVILKNTRLGKLYESGDYETFTFDEVVEIASDGMISFAENGIRVIKCGLHASEFVENEMIGGFYHPAFREICENRIYRNKISEIVSHSGRYILKVNNKCISKATGQKKSNIQYFKNKYNAEIKIIPDNNIPVYEVEEVK